MSSSIFLLLPRPIFLSSLIFLSQGTHPKQWAEAIIATPYKKGDSLLPDNYRPITLLNAAYKLYARMLHHRLQQLHSEKVRPTQFGFRKGHSTDDALGLLRRYLELLTSTQHSAHVHLIFLDWEKAFDRISHKGLVLALERLKVPPQIINCIKMIYKNPRFQVKYLDELSSVKTQKTGVRQGCPLSPYLLYCVLIQ